MRLEDLRARIAQEGFAVDIGAAMASFGPSLKQFLDHDPRKGANPAPGGQGRGPGRRVAFPVQGDPIVESAQFSLGPALGILAGLPCALTPRALQDIEIERATAMQARYPGLPLTEFTARRRDVATERSDREMQTILDARQLGGGG